MNCKSEDYYGLRCMGLSCANEPFIIHYEEFSFSEYLLNHKSKNVTHNGYIYEYVGDIISGIDFLCTSLDTEKEGYVKCTPNAKVKVITDLNFTHKIEVFLRDAMDKIIPSKKQEPTTYIIYDKANDCYKIGKSLTPEKRLESLRLSNPEIQLILVCEKDIESSLHSKFYKKRKGREWFNLDADDILELIEKYNFKKP